MGNSEEFPIFGSKFKVLSAKILFFNQFSGNLDIITLDLNEINA